QGGQAKEAVAADPDGSGPQLAHVQQFVYDAAGRQVGTREGSTASVAVAPWNCTTYDGRNRMLRQTWPARGAIPARTVVYDYAFNGNPFHSRVTENSPDNGVSIISTVVNLLHQVTNYN